MASLISAIPLLGGGAKGEKVLSQNTFEVFSTKLYEIFSVLDKEEEKRDRINARLEKLKMRHRKTKKDEILDDGEDEEKEGMWDGLKKIFGMLKGIILTQMLGGLKKIIIGIRAGFRLLGVLFRRFTGLARLILRMLGFKIKIPKPPKVGLLKRVAGLLKSAGRGAKKIGNFIKKLWKKLFGPAASIAKALGLQTAKAVKALRAKISNLRSNLKIQQYGLTAWRKVANKAKALRFKAIQQIWKLQASVKVLNGRIKGLLADAAKATSKAATNLIEASKEAARKAVAKQVKLIESLRGQLKGLDGQLKGANQALAAAQKKISAIAKQLGKLGLKGGTAVLSTAKGIAGAFTGLKESIINTARDAGFKSGKKEGVKAKVKATQIKADELLSQKNRDLTSKLQQQITENNNLNDRNKNLKNQNTRLQNAANVVKKKPPVNLKAGANIASFMDAPTMKGTPIKGLNIDSLKMKGAPVSKIPVMQPAPNAKKSAISKVVTLALKAAKFPLGWMLRKLPFGIGVAFSAWFATIDFLKGDYTGGTIMTVSGIASAFPGIGTGISIGADVIYITRTVYNSLYASDMKNHPNVKFTASKTIFDYHFTTQPMLVASRLPEIKDEVLRQIMEMIKSKEMTEQETLKAIEEYKKGGVYGAGLSITELHSGAEKSRIMGEIKRKKRAGEPLTGELATVDKDIKAWKKYKNLPPWSGRWDPSQKGGLNENQFLAARDAGEQPLLQHMTKLREEEIGELGETIKGGTTITNWSLDDERKELVELKKELALLKAHVGKTRGTAKMYLQPIVGTVSVGHGY